MHILEDWIKIFPIDSGAWILASPGTVCAAMESLGDAGLLEENVTKFSFQC